MLDNKFTSRIAILVALQSAFAVILTSVLSKDDSNSFILPSLYIFLIWSLALLLLLVLYYCFFKSFFRLKKNYRVMPTAEIRMFHFYIYRNKLIGTQEENDLYSYMIDSYQFCAFSNAQINTKRESYLIRYDIIASISFVISICTYSFLCYYGVPIVWIF